MKVRNVLVWGLCVLFMAPIMAMGQDCCVFKVAKIKKTKSCDSCPLNVEIGDLVVGPKCRKRSGKCGRIKIRRKAECSTGGFCRFRADVVGCEPCP